MCWVFWFASVCLSLGFTFGLVGFFIFVDMKFALNVNAYGRMPILNNKFALNSWYQYYDRCVYGYFSTSKIYLSTFEFDFNPGMVVSSSVSSFFNDVASIHTNANGKGLFLFNNMVTFFFTLRHGISLMISSYSPN